MPKLHIGNRKFGGKIWVPAIAQAGQRYCDKYARFVRSKGLKARVVKSSAEVERGYPICRVYTPRGQKNPSRTGMAWDRFK